jgi:hypothetical protein
MRRQKENEKKNEFPSSETLRVEHDDDDDGALRCVE